MSDERRAIIARETEREAKAAEWEAEQRRQASFERRQEMLMRGQVPRSHADVLASVSVGMDRQDRREAASEARNAELYGHGRPHQTAALLAPAKSERKQRESEEANQPASKADVKKVAQQLADRVQQLKTGILAITGWSPL
jgi:hypothetical protein